jgi:hypothetical protein
MTVPPHLQGLLLSPAKLVVDERMSHPMLETVPSGILS